MSLSRSLSLSLFLVLPLSLYLSPLHSLFLSFSPLCYVCSFPHPVVCLAFPVSLWRSSMQPSGRSISQSAQQSVEQPVNLSVSPSVNQAVRGKRANTRSVSHPTAHLRSHSVKQPASKSVVHGASFSAVGSIKQSLQPWSCWKERSRADSIHAPLDFQFVLCLAAVFYCPPPPSFRSILPLLLLFPFCFAVCLNM